MKLIKGKIYHGWMYAGYSTSGNFTCDLCHKPRQNIHEFIHPDTEYGQWKYDNEPMRLGNECVLKFVDYGLSTK